MGPVNNVKGIQWLMGCLTALNQFVSWLGECELPLYKLMKKSDSFHWMEETHKALDELKTLITKPPILALWDTPSVTIVAIVVQQYLTMYFPMLE
jgi:hypothetical protein